MNARSRAASRLAGAGDTALWISAVALLVGFVIAFGARPAVVLSTAGLDDALFMRLGQSLAAGEWLGPYNQNTLAKGMGFPAFLAIANVTGLPFTLSLALWHAACAGFAAWVVRRITGSRIAGLLLLALLVFLPTLYFGDQTRAFRDVFYAGLTLALVASAVTLASRKALPGPVAIGLTGGLGAWWWLTREEGVWLIPTLLLIALLPLAGGFDGQPRPKGVRPMLRNLAPAGGALVIAALLITGVGAVNAAVYGRFVVNEVQDDNFEGALEALQAAAAPYADERVPVPADARAQIYRVSPAFAELRAAGLDGPMVKGFLDVGCQVDRRICGDIGGGWFFWALRDVTAAQGHHRSPAEAAAFYGRIEDEVRGACEDGRLQCKDWPVPLAPPMKASQIDDVEASLGAVVNVVTFGLPVWSDALPSDLGAPDGEALYDFLNRPHYVAPRVQRSVTGWYAGRGDRWFEVEVEDGSVTRFDRTDSPDIAIAFKDPGMARQRFIFEVDCPVERCAAALRFQDAPGVTVDLKALEPGGWPAGLGTFYVDAVEPDAARPLLKTRFSNGWMAVARGLNPLFRVVAVLGVLAAIVVVIRSLLARRITPLAVLCVALAGAVAARVLILALIDALSFPAANPVYAMPAAPLILMLAVVAGFGAFRGLRRPRV
ncbi:hypothetical protein [Phenylobacterium sp. J367]|uniref:hypothetical protein n=1 Tax=Phenylobacterium sp. J367 TaxID=2898435 RepID=UPI0021508B5E|nr:hypothetical protein [Phenylobacterium sp. J367]MCR5877658.1 hypothetical protein [Phenylobacterium sp. J367]